MFAFLTAVAPFVLCFLLGAVAMLLLIDILNKDGIERAKVDLYLALTDSTNLDYQPNNRSTTILNYDKM